MKKYFTLSLLVVCLAIAGCRYKTINYIIYPGFSINPDGSGEHISFEVSAAQNIEPDVTNETLLIYNNRISLDVPSKVLKAKGAWRDDYVNYLAGTAYERTNKGMVEGGLLHIECDNTLMTDDHSEQGAVPGTVARVKSSQEKSNYYVYCSHIPTVILGMEVDHTDIIEVKYRFVVYANPAGSTIRSQVGATNGWYLRN